MCLPKESSGSHHTTVEDDNSPYPVTENLSSTLLGMRMIVP